MAYYFDWEDIMSTWQSKLEVGMLIKKSSNQDLKHNINFRVTSIILIKTVHIDLGFLIKN